MFCRNHFFPLIFYFTGTNWTHEIVHMLIHRSTEFAPLFSFVENFTGDVLEKRESPRSLCSHLLPKMLPGELGHKGKIIIVVRNPKDVAVSVHNFLKSLNFVDYNADWEQYLQLFYDGNRKLFNLEFFYFKHTMQNFDIYTCCVFRPN